MPPTAAQSKPHFSILATSFAGGPPPRRTATIVFGLWFLLFFFALFSPPLLDDADATHAQAAQAMARTGDLVTLHVNGVRYLEKAPLPYWLAALSFKLFGFNTFAAHLPQALAVLLLALLGYRWANQAFGSRTGFYTALGILTSVGVFLFTRVLIPEVLLSLTLAAALFAFLKSLGPISPPAPRMPRVLASEANHKAGIFPPVSPISPAQAIERPSIAWHAGPLFYPYVMWASLALAVLSKGLVALVFFFATTLAFLTLTADWPKVRKLRPFTGLLLFLAIAGPWHILAGLRNPAPAGGHGFWWFYFYNEHILRFLGRRIPADYNRMPGWLYWTQHLLWLFPWTLFLPLGITALYRRVTHQTRTLTRNSWLLPTLRMQFALGLLGASLMAAGAGVLSAIICIIPVYGLVLVGQIRFQAGFHPSPFHRIDPQQRTLLLLALFTTIILLFFSLSTNQEYYTFPAYLPLLLLIAATITRAEQTYSTNPSAVRWVNFAHAAFTTIGWVAALALLYGLWSSRHLPYNPDLGTVLAHRGIGSYTLATSHLFDLTTESFAGLRTPAVLATLALLLGPPVAWALRTQRRHLAATTSVAFTMAAFLLAAHLAFARFAPILSSRDFATTIQYFPPDTPVLLFGDQSYGSSIPFYLSRPVSLIDGRTTSMQFGSTYPDVPPGTFLTPTELQRLWTQPQRILLFIPAERREEALHLLPPNPHILRDESGKLLLTNQP